MKTKQKLKKLLALVALAFGFVMLSSQQLKAQANCGANYLIENNTNCKVTVNVRIFCNGAPCIVYPNVSIPPHTTYTAIWPASCSHCERCEVRVELLDIGGQSYPPGMYYVDSTMPVKNYPPPPAGCKNNGDVMKWFPGVTMIDF